MIRYLDRGEIDVEKWDEVIAQSPAETIYPYSWYLDVVADKWSALVMDDYSLVMPLVWKKKLGIKYLYQPLYTQQLGIFGSDLADPLQASEMLKVLYEKFRFAEINFNTKNMVGEGPHFRVEDRSNYILSLEQDYQSHYEAFSTNAKRNIRKADDLGDLVEKNLSVEELFRLKRENDVIQRSEADYRWLECLLGIIMERNAGKIYGIRKDKTLLAATIFVFSKTRAIYLVSASGDVGKERRAMFKIMDSFIRDHAGTGLILDFEGSNIPSIARFFGGFGAHPEVYQHVSFSRLPAILDKLR
jgi:hypothetical protein